MAHLKIRGLQNLIEVPDHEAIEYKRKLMQGLVKKDSLVSIGGFTGEAQQIASVILPETRIQDNKTLEIIKEYQELRRKYLSMSPEDRATINLPFFDFVFYAFTGERPNEETQQKAITETNAFFALDPEAENRMYASPVIWKNIIKPFESEVITNFYRGHAIKIIERVIENDVHDAKNVFLNSQKNNDFGGTEEPDFTV